MGGEITGLGQIWKLVRCGIFGSEELERPCYNYEVTKVESLKDHLSYDNRRSGFKPAKVAMHEHKKGKRVVTKNNNNMQMQMRMRQ